MPRFCRVCGAAIGARAPVACAACGAEHWPNASPAGGALVVHEGRVLLVRRAHEPWLGRWCAPSGFCEGPEHPAAAAEREAFEEAGLRVRVVGYLGHWIDEYRPGGEDGLDPQYCAVSYFHAVPAGPVELRPDATEVAEARWFAPDELPDELAPPGNGPRIFGAWREALRAGRLESPLPDVAA
ncbi:MAG TPA: NUDIX domain-containing protein [Gaiellaceae bacterium]|nr:NUDIX domain-containing protein [Gaiellaceae bacterium]